MTSAIPVRHLTFNLEQVETHYFDHNPMLSNMLNALSILFPHGERMFVESVRAIRHHIYDEKLQKDISGFIGQEAMHSKIHAEFNQFVEQRFGIISKRFTDAQLRRIKFTRKFLGRKRTLAATVGLEHITATFATYLLTHPEFIKGLDESVKPIWLWHALEEIEHKSVAFDTYQAAYSDAATRYYMMALVTSIFLFDAFRITTILTLREKPTRFAFNKHWQAAKKIAQFFEQTTPNYLEYFSPNFHPDNEDTAELVKVWRKNLAFIGV